jgi:hypothetical protein
MSIKDNAPGRFSIGVNVTPMACLNDLNKLLKEIHPIAKEMPWKHWEDIMSYPNTFLITCFDDKNNEVVAMATLIIITKPSGKFALFCDNVELNLEWTIKINITTTMFKEAKKIAKRQNAILVSEITTLSFIP